ncbi:TPA: acyltransferase, partial [Escherichia coli]|nr:acyltransferase [Escherichia coli]
FLVWALLKNKLPYSNYKNITIAMSKFTGEKGVILRQYFYKLTLDSCGHNLRVHYGAFFVYPNVKVGNNCTVEEYSIVSLCDLGDDVIIAARVSIMSGGNHHEIDKLDIKFVDSLLPLKKVKIGSNVWIGTHAIVMNDIPDGMVVGAGSVVTKVFQPDSIIAGIPAKVMRKRGKS